MSATTIIIHLPKHLMYENSAKIAELRSQYPSSLATKANIALKFSWIDTTSIEITVLTCSLSRLDKVLVEQGYTKCTNVLGTTIYNAN